MLNWLKERGLKYGPKYGPLAAAALAMLGAGAIAVFAGCHIQPIPEMLAATTATWGIVMIGFAGTERTMILGLGGSKVLRYAANTNLYLQVIKYFTQYTGSSLLLVIISVGCLLFDGVEADYYKVICWVLWAGSLVLALALLVRNELLMRKIIERFIEDQKSI